MHDDPTETMLLELKARLRNELSRLVIELTELTEESPDPAGPRLVRFRAEVQRQYSRIRRLMCGLADADPTLITRDRAGFGSTIELRDLVTGDERIHTLNTAYAASPECGDLSITSPLGRLLLGCRSGAEVEMSTPAGKRRYRVVALVTLPQQLGIRDAWVPALP